LTEVGTLNLELLVLTMMDVAAEAFCDKVTVQVVEVLGLIAVGLHVRDETSTANLKLTVCVAPYPLAVKVTLGVPLVIVPAVAVKVAEVAPAGTLTETGTVSVAALLERA
jgi:hypothetical protein